MEWHTKLGGRKFILTVLGMGLVALGPKQGATVDYYLTLGGMVAAFVGGNVMVDRAHAGKPAPRDSSGLPVNG